MRCRLPRGPQRQAAAGAELHAGAARLAAGQAVKQTGTAGQQLERAEDAAGAAH